MLVSIVAGDTLALELPSTNMLQSLLEVWHSHSRFVSLAVIVFSEWLWYLAVFFYLLEQAEYEDANDHQRHSENIAITISKE